MTLTYNLLSVYHTELCPERFAYLIKPCYNAVSLGQLHLHLTDGKTEAQGGCVHYAGSPKQ